MSGYLEYLSIKYNSVSTKGMITLKYDLISEATVKKIQKMPFHSWKKLSC